MCLFYTTVFLMLLDPCQYPGFQPELFSCGRVQRSTTSCPREADYIWPKMSGVSQRIDNYISLKPVRLEDFRCSYNHSYPTPVQLVKHLYQLDQRIANYAGGTFSHWLNRRSASATVSNSCHFAIASVG